MKEILVQFEVKEISAGGVAFPEIIIQAHNLRSDEIAGILSFAFVHAAKQFIENHPKECRCPALELAIANVASHKENFKRLAPKP